MDSGFLLVAFAYLAFTAGVILFEFRRTRANGIDAISVFVAIFLLQCCLSAIAIFGLLPFVDRDNPTSVYAFNKILGQIDVPTGMLVFTLTAAFLLFFYVGCTLGRASLERLWPKAPDVLLVTVNKWRIGLTLLLGMILTLYSFMLLDDTMIGRYTNLVMLRSNDPRFVRTALNANAFSLTETWAWLTVIAIFCFIEARWRRVLLPIFVVIAVLFAVFGVSRRALFIPILMSYLTIVLYSNRWRLRWILAAAVPILVWVAFGKNLIATVAYGGSLDTVAAMYQSWQSAVIRAASDVGITVVESAGTVELIDLPPRLGGDHVLSMMKIFPERTLGFEVDYPERIVRISTAALDTPDAADLPPGLMGQMWLDFRLAGPLLWGIAFGLQISVIQWFFERTRCTRQASAVFVVLVFIVALPLNTGSFDFTFSVNIVAIAILLLICINIRRGRLVAARELNPQQNIELRTELSPDNNRRVT
jgi:hypothetical protein